MNEFQKIYPFTTETISGYITKMDIKNKSVLTLGSSCDQALNSLLLGASDVTIFDINEQVEYFYNLKRKLILSLSRKELIQNVITLKQFSYFDDIFTYYDLKKMNLYLKNDENYCKLQNILKEKTINFKVGNILEISKYLENNKKYDRVILSNVLDYIAIGLGSEEIVFKIYNDLLPYLNNEALIQLYYLYGSIKPEGFIKVVNKFLENDILLGKIQCDSNDSVIFVKKK